ncbi:MAG: DUF4830 domain-containing protein [Oscillospiraceae bacterium]|nr:DUF4830 domain-containing protein [Oscillospiraceae bacterium]
MFIFTAKVSRRRLLAGAAAAAFLCGAIVVAASLLQGKDTVVSTGGTAKLRSDEDRVAYLEQYGWQVIPEPVSVEELIIPEEFDETYSQYLELQNSQGFDLSQLKGKRVKRYTYEITNYPTGETGVLAGLLIYRNAVVGGDVLSSDLGGFIHGLEMP